MLIYILTNRTKPQMERIDKFYQEQHGKTVHQQVLDELSGDFETFMLTLMRDQCEADCKIVILSRFCLLRVPLTPKVSLFQATRCSRR